MIDYLLLAIAIGAISQRNALRREAATFFAAMTIGHGVIASEFDGFLYYWSAAAVDLAVIVGLAYLPAKSRLIVDLQRISILSMALNALGFILWLSYTPPTGYNLSFVVVYTLAIGAMMRRDDVGRPVTRSRGWVGVHRAVSPRGPNINKHGG